MNKHVLVVILAAAIVLVSPAAAFWAADSDADSAYSGDTASYYYSQLNDSEKKIYEAMEDLKSASGNGYDESSGKFTVTVSGVSYSSEDQAYTAVLTAANATQLDDPYAFWVWGVNAGYQSTTGSTIEITSTSSLTFTINALSDYTLTALSSASGTTYSSYSDVITAIEARVTEISDGFGFSSSDTTLTKIEKINFHLTSASIYRYDPNVDKDNEWAYDHTVVGAFLIKNTDENRYVVVCDGYSNAFTLLARASGISVINVIGLGAQSSDNGYHAWNEVIIDGSEVYGVDITFDSTGDDKKAYLCCGAYDKVDGATFSQSHQPFAFYSDYNTAYYPFYALQLSDSGYTWPAEDSLADTIMNIAPWIVMGLICLILVYVLITIAKKGE